MARTKQTSRPTVPKPQSKRGITKKAPSAPVARIDTGKRRHRFRPGTVALR